MTAPRELGLRERKKARTRRELAATALRMFLERGFEHTTLDELVHAVEISKRTFFRTYRSKEEVGIAAEIDLWEAYLDEIARREPCGVLLTWLRQALTDTIAAMDPEWSWRFLATRGLCARTPALRDHSDLTSLTVQRRLVEALEVKLAVDRRDDVRLRLLAELALSAWRCGAKNWIRTERAPEKSGRLGLTSLIGHVERAFDAIPATVALAADAAARPAPRTAPA